jgi:hypothetical protein
MFNLKQYIANGGTPQKLLSDMMLQNPMMNNLIQMAKSGNTQSVETFARNLFREQGRDFDKELAEFKSNFMG